MPTPDQVREAAESHVKFFSGGDRESWLAIFADDADFTDPYPSPPAVGREGLEAFWDRVYAMAGDYRFDVKQLVVAGDRAAMTFTLSMAIGGDRYEFDAVDVFEVADSGRIARFTAYWDPTAVTPV